MEENNDFEEFYTGLQILSDSAFPKKCTTCGRVYETAEDFLQATRPMLGSSGLIDSIDDDENPIVEVYRNCVCGSTLMEFFSDRRDITSKGQKRRETFGKILKLLIDKYELDEPVARNELIKIIHGNSSPLLESLGVKIRRSNNLDTDNPDNTES